MRPTPRQDLNRTARKASTTFVILMALMTAGCSYHSAFIRYDEYTEVTLQPEPFDGVGLGRVRITEGGALWKECTDVARGSLWLLVEEARRRGGNAVGDIRWMPEVSGSTLEQPTCRRRWALFLVWPLLATPAFMRANVEGSVYRVNAAAADVAGLYVLPDTTEELGRLIDTILADTAETVDPSQPTFSLER